MFSRERQYYQCCMMPGATWKYVALELKYRKTAKPYISADGQTVGL